MNIITNVYLIKRPIATSRWCRHLWLLKRSIQNFLSIRMAESPRSTIMHTLYAYFILYNSMFISLPTIFNPIWRQIKLVQSVLIPWQSNSKFSITVRCSDLVLRVIVHYSNIHYISGLLPQNFAMLQTIIHGNAPFQVKRTRCCRVRGGDTRIRIYQSSLPLPHSWWACGISIRYGWIQTPVGVVGAMWRM